MCFFCTCEMAYHAPHCVLFVLHPPHGSSAVPCDSIERRQDLGRSASESMGDLYARRRVSGFFLDDGKFRRKFVL